MSIDMIIETLKINKISGTYLLRIHVHIALHFLLLIHDCFSLPHATSNFYVSVKSQTLENNVSFKVCCK